MRAWSRATGAAALLVTIALLGGCTGQVQPPAPQAAGATVALPTCTGIEEFTVPKTRVVVTEGGVLDTFAALGVADRVVARSGRSSTPSPENAALFANVPEIGSGPPSTEGLLAADPDLVVQALGWHLDPAQGGADAAAVRASGAQIYPNRPACSVGTEPSRQDTLDGVLTDITGVGALTGVSDRAERLTAALRTRRDDIAARVAREPRVRGVQLSVVGGQLFATGAGLPAEQLAVAGMENLFPDPTQVYVPVSPEVITARDPQAISLFTFPTEDVTTQIAYLRRTFPATDAVRSGRIGTIESRKGGSGPAAYQGLAELAHFLHPAAVPAPSR